MGFNERMLSINLEASDLTVSFTLKGASSFINYILLYTLRDPD